MDEGAVRKLPALGARFRCRCQAFALTGDVSATDPVCHLAPDHARVAKLAAVRTDAPYIYRRMGSPHRADVLDGDDALSRRRRS
jgi:hypothetical protein